MKKKLMLMIGILAVIVSAVACGKQEVATATESASETIAAPVEDGVYSADFTTDSGMFHVNEAKNGKGTLTVKDGEMTIHVSLASDKIVNLFAGKAEDAQKDGAALIEPTTDTVTYSDGATDEVYGFDIPVPVIDEEFDVALIGTHGNWYDHKVKVSNLEKTDTLADGTYTPDDFSWSGGSGHINITCGEIKIEDGQAYATIVFNSSYYTTVKVDGTSYDGLATEDSASFTIPVTLNKENAIIGTTTRMTTPHDIEYIITPYLEAAGGEKPAGNTENEEDTDGEATPAAAIAIAHTPPEISGLTYESQMELDYAKGFDVFYYQDGYAVINVYDSAQYLVVPEGKAAPEGLESQIKVLQQPLDNIYMAATSVMALFRAMDALADIRFAGMEADGWYVQEAAEAINNGTMLFAGKYSEPDYELLVDKGCDLAIESTMILHDPKVQEMIESLGIPVFIERSSYEAHPLGRTEWIKLYGVLVGKEDEAKTFFDKQAEIISQLADFQNTEKTVAFFYVDTNGTVVVRKSDDYIPSMIQIAGGRYIFSDLQNEESSSASVSLSMEEFYASAMNADYLIYNGTIDLPLSSVKDLLAKSELFAEFKAVKDGNVWTIGKDLYQSTDIVGQLIGDVHKMLTDDATGDMTFLKKVD